MLIEKGANLAQITVDGEKTLDTIFRNLANPAEFLNEVLSSQVQANSYEKCNTDFCITVGKYVYLIHAAIYSVKIDFRVLMPFGEDNQMAVVSHILLAANEEEKIKILQHPLIGMSQ